MFMRKSRVSVSYVMMLYVFLLSYTMKEGRDSDYNKWNTAAVLYE